MSKAIAAAAVAFALAAPGHALAQAKAEPPDALAGFGWFAELAGSCWKGDHPHGKSSDTQCYEVRYGRIIRGTIKIAREGAPGFEGEGVFAIDITGKRVMFAQWGTGGAFGMGELTFEGEALVFRNRNSDGTLVPVRTVWRRTGPEAFRVTREREVPDKGWSRMLEVEYRRVR
jgi:hypothetical protein